jgi:hypothetical protein
MLARDRRVWSRLLQARRNKKKCSLQMEGIADFAEGKLNFLGGETVFIVARRIL